MFAAYAEKAKELEENEKSTVESTWLQNSSFKSNLVLEKPTDDKKTSEISDKKLKTKKRKREKKKKHAESHAGASAGKNVLVKAANQSEEEFILDKLPTREYLTVNTISRPAVSKYHVTYYLHSRYRDKKSKIKRYFKVRQSEEEPKEEPKITKENVNKLNLGKRDENYTGFTQEEELTKTTAFYNKELEKNPVDIQMWLEYVKFQDNVFQFEKYYKKGSIAKAQRVQAEKKISILDKAINFNPDSELLLRERLRVAVSAFPSDELQMQFRKLVDKEKNNIILWQGFIESTQCSMSHCNSPAVLALYSECLSVLHQLRRTTVTEKHIFEENILRMLYQCGLFLKQAGLFEQLWTLLKMYMELNLNPEKKFEFEIYFNEKELLELEEVVLSSHLPHHELWLRIEKLRESCHWLPFNDPSNNCEDPQRMVFNEDVAELIHPITMPENIFKLVAIILTMLKVPLLPCRHCTIQDLGLDYVPWSVDSIEAILPVFMPLYPVDTINENLLKETTRLAVGPQFLRGIPGQEEYLSFIMTIMDNCAESLKNKDQFSLRIWWFRFQRLLIILGNQERFKMPSYLRKKIKTNIKELLKRAEYRNNEIFYVEYALIEKAMGNTEQCIKILETALKMHQNFPISVELLCENQINQCHLYRILIETLIEQNNEQMAKELLVKLVLQRSFSNLTNGLIMEAESKFKTIIQDLLLMELSNLSVVDHFLPDFFTDFIICHGWFLYLTKGPLLCGTFLEDVLIKLEEKTINISYQKELLFEFYCAVLFKYCLRNPGSGIFKILDEVLYRAIEKFPNNLYLLSILAKEQSITKNFGISAWKIHDLLLKSGRSIASIFAIIINDLVRVEIENQAIDSITGQIYDLGPAFKNRMLSLFKKITARNTYTRRCGLIWRLYLQFVHTFFTPNICRNVYYTAVEECPWLKALYMDAAIYIPAELGQIQDLIIEKQLRLHVTPEELDILRS